MKTVRVTYTAKADYVEQNQKNIQQVMAELQKLNHAGILYHACLGADGRTFTHTAFFNSEGDEKILLGLPAFIHFQEQLKAKGLETPPKQELLSLVGSSKQLFS
jgi:hypothetical protein